MQPPLAVQGIPYDGKDPLLPLECHLDPVGRAGGSAGRLLDLRQGPFDDVPIGQPGRLGQGPQRDQEGECLVHGQLQRPGDARRLEQGDGVALELEVDEVARAVAGQPAQPDQVEVAAQLLLGDVEDRGRLRHLHARVLQQVRHERQQPGQLGQGATHVVRLSSRRTTASRASSGPSTTASAP